MADSHRKLYIMAFLATVLLFPTYIPAATSPTVARLEFKDTAGTLDPSDDVINTIITGHEANRVSVDVRGNVYISDPVANSVSVYNTNGKLVKQLRINRAIAVGVSGSGGLVYVSGSINGASSVFVIDNNNNGKNENGNLGIDWARPSDIEVDPSGNVYVADSAKNIIRRFDAEGRIREFGPYGGEMYTSETLDGSVFQRTRHRMVFPEGVAVDEAKGLLYVSVKEFVESLSNAPADNYYPDTEESWKHYNYNFNLNIPTDSAYSYWIPVTVPSATGYHVLVIDINTGTIKKKITVGDGGDYALKPRGLALDGKGRLYVAAMGGMTAAGGEIKVYDAETGAMLGTNGGFDPGMYIDIAFSLDETPDPDPSKAKGRLFATVAGSNTVATYSIDGGTNRTNSPPSPPVILFPAAGTYVSSLSPVLSVQNATDPDGDPLTYGYEIREGGALLTSLSGFEEGSGNTGMNVSYPLKENTLYRWRAQAFDGTAAAWSKESEFCVNERNDNPTTPSVMAPKGEGVSPFASSLSWSPSTDPDCYDILSYTVEVSNQSGFSTMVSDIGSTSLPLGSIKGLVNGEPYSWRVKAVDNNGGESAYSEGSFVYRTTVVKFESDQPDTRVYIDGNYGYYGKAIGTAPLEVQDITPGSHFVTFRKAGYEPYHIIVNVPDPLSGTGGSPTEVASMVKASKIRPSSSGVELELVKINGGNATPFVVDYNNDGLKDIVVGGGDGWVYLYLSEEQLQADGTKKVVLVDKGAIEAIKVGSRAIPFLVDYNNDGKKDLLVGSHDGLIYLYVNAGTDESPDFVSAGTLKDSSGDDIKVLNSVPVVVDYNNDGRKDLVVGGNDGGLRLYKNIGTDASPEYDPIYETIKADNADLNISLNSKPFFTDWNSDGKKDLVVGRGIADGDGNTANLFFNVGTDDSPVFLSVTGLKKWIKEKKRERGNREWLPYIPYIGDSGSPAEGSLDASIFILDWSGTSARDIVVGSADGDVKVHVSGNSQ